MANSNRNILKILIWVLVGISISPSANAIQCISLFDRDRIGFPELNVAKERMTWRKVVRDGGGGELDYFIRQLFVRKYKSEPEFAEDVISALTDQAKRFEFLFFLKSRVIQRLESEGNPQEIADYNRTQTIPERLLRIELIEMAKNSGFEVVVVSRKISPSDFVAMMHKRQLPIDLAFVDQPHGHLIHILQVLQIVFHIDKKYQQPGKTARFYQQLSGINYHSNWELIFDDQNDPGSAPEVWNPIYQNYLKWDF